MPALDLQKRLGSTLEVDLCAACRTIWFDRYEDLQLSPAATLKLFAVIGESSSAAAGALPGGSIRCPRCRAALRHTHDIQRNTRFQYWRCDAGHGRLMTYVDFLRAKDFVRPLTPPQLAELRENVQTINCSNCGAPVDLAKDSVCRHCGSAVSMLDLKQMAKTVAQLQAAAASQRPEGAVDLTADQAEREPTDINALVLAFKAQRRDSPLSLVDAGMDLLGDLLKKMLR
jgi:DNA-directed RNA polymerase subunit RPC12/RpoP